MEKCGKISKNLSSQKCLDLNHKNANDLSNFDAIFVIEVEKACKTVTASNSCRVSVYCDAVMYKCSGKKVKRDSN